MPPRVEAGGQHRVPRGKPEMIRLGAFDDVQMALMATSHVATKRASTALVFRATRQ